MRYDRVSSCLCWFCLLFTLFFLDVAPYNKDVPLVSGRIRACAAARYKNVQEQAPLSTIWAQSKTDNIQERTCVTTAEATWITATQFLFVPVWFWVWFPNRPLFMPRPSGSLCPITVCSALLFLLFDLFYLSLCCLFCALTCSVCSLVLLDDLSMMTAFMFKHLRYGYIWLPSDGSASTICASKKLFRTELPVHHVSDTPCMCSMAAYLPTGHGCKDG